MDEVDLHIIKRMAEDARVSFRKIAEELKVSPDTIINRYKTLQQKGVIRGSTVVINPKKIGYNGMAVFMIDASPTHILANETTPPESSLILKRLIQMRNIILATKTVGDHDLLAIGVARDFKHLIEIGAEIAKIPGVKDLRVSFWAEKTELCPKYFII
ncbi:MAG: Lrp/AsnC family transcriptional regulator [Candidatus Bathycorpusculaceae bacterium]